MRSGKRNAKRMLVLALVLCFAMISLLSQTVVLTHARHTHDHNGSNGACYVCEHISAVTALHKQFGAGVQAALLAACMFMALALLLPPLYRVAAETPVHLKTRLNN